MIIGFTGLAGSGKDTAADFLVQDHNFVRIGLADKLKRICKEVFDFSDEQLWGPSSMRNEPDKRYKRADCPNCKPGVDPGGCEGPGPLYLTPRYALQQLGTEWGRDCYGDVWVEDVMRTAKLLLRDYMKNEDTVMYDMKRGLYSSGRYIGDANLWRPEEMTKAELPRGVVISDVRFKNEMSAILRAGGYIVRMKRGKGLSGDSGVHQSEAEQLEVPDEYFSAVIHNEDLSLDELRQEVTKLFVRLC